MVDIKLRRKAKMLIKLFKAFITALLFIAKYARNKEEIIKALEEIRKDLK